MLIHGFNPNQSSPHLAGPVMVAHHFLSIIGLTWCLMAGHYGTELVATIGGAEITNPLLQLRWFLREMGHYRGTIWGHLVDWAFMVSFGFIRIILGSILLYCYYQQVDSLSVVDFIVV